MTTATSTTVRERIEKVKNLLMYLILEVQDGAPVVHDVYQEVLAIEKEMRYMGRHTHEKR